MMIEAKSLLTQIDEQFGRVPYPGDDNIVRDTSGAHLESEEIKEALVGHHWRNVPFEMLDQLRSALFFLSPEGYRFYLPAFMFFAVTDFDRADVIPDEVIQTLTFPNPSDMDRIEELAQRHPEMQPFSSEEWKQILSKMAEMYRSGSAERTFFERVSGFDAAQSEVIRQFLEYMQNVYGNEFPNREPQIAIERYWYRF